MTRTRAARALGVGIAAAAAYLGGAKLSDARPVRTGGLLALATVGLTGLIATSSGSKAASVEARLNNMLANGFAVSGRIDVLSGNLHMHGGNVDLEGGSVVP